MAGGHWYSCGERNGIGWRLAAAYYGWPCWAGRAAAVVGVLMVCEWRSINGVYGHGEELNANGWRKPSNEWRRNGVTSVMQPMAAGSYY